MSEQEIIKKAVEIIKRRMAPHGTCKIFLFGSRAEGRATAKSDFDIGIESEKAVPAGMIYQIEEELDVLPDLRKVEVVDFGRLTGSFKRVAAAHRQVLA